jgi:MFS family permease
MDRTISLARLVCASGIAAVGLAAGGVGASLLGAELSGSTANSGLPVGLVVVGTALGAFLIARLTGHLGRHRALSVGYGLGAGGALVVVFSAISSSFPIMLLGATGTGIAQAALFLSRYAAADSAPERQRGRAVGLILVSVALGAVVSPNLLGPGAELALRVGVPASSGIFLIAAGAFATAALLISSGRAAHQPDPCATDLSLAQVVRGLSQPAPLLAIASLGVTNILMVTVMTVVPIDLIQHGHSLELVGLMISAHVAAMFGPSPITGWLADRFQPRRVVTIGLGLVLLAAVCGLSGPHSDPTLLTAFLVLLGAGWNCGIVGGSTMLVRSLPATLRPQAEASGEVAMGIAAAVGAPLSGLVLAIAGLNGVWLSAVALASIALLGRLGLGQPRVWRHLQPSFFGSQSSGRVDQNADPTRRAVSAIHE